jgi:hypothetical protein
MITLLMTLWHLAFPVSRTCKGRRADREGCARGVLNGLPPVIGRHRLLGWKPEKPRHLEHEVATDGRRDGSDRSLNQRVRGSNPRRPTWTFRHLPRSPRADRPARGTTVREACAFSPWEAPHADGSARSETD